MATEASYHFLGRLFINQYVFKRDVRLQLLCCTLRRLRLCCSEYSAIAAVPATPAECPNTDLRTVSTPVDSSV